MVVKNKKQKRKLNKFLKILFIIVGIYLIYLALIFGSVLIEFITNGDRLDKESKAYIDKNVPVIVNDWNKDELKLHADKEFLASVSDKEFDDLFNYSSTTYGKMKSYSGSDGEAGINAMVWNFVPNVTRRAEYNAKVQFEKGSANIRVVLIKREDEWYITGFFIKSI